MNVFVLCLPFLFVACTNFRMANVAPNPYLIEVLPIKTEGGVLLQREIALQLISSGFSDHGSEAKKIFCRVEVEDDTASPISNSAEGKARRAKHKIALELTFEDDNGNEIFKPFKISSTALIGFMDPDNEKSMSFEYNGNEHEAKELLMDQFLLADEAQERSRTSVYRFLASKIVMHLQNLTLKELQHGVEVSS